MSHTYACNNNNFFSYFFSISINVANKMKNIFIFFHKGHNIFFKQPKKIPILAKQNKTKKKVLYIVNDNDNDNDDTELINCL